MFTRKKKKKAKPIAPLMFYSNNDLFFNSYLTENLDPHAIRCLTFLMMKANNTKEKMQVSYKDIRAGSELSCNNYVQRSLKTLSEMKLIEVNVVKKVMTVKLLYTARKMKTS